MTAPYAKRTHCRRGHEYTSANIRLEIIKSYNGVKYVSRRCKACQNITTKNWYKKNGRKSCLQPQMSET